MAEPLPFGNRTFVHGKGDRFVLSGFLLIRLAARHGNGIRSFLPFEYLHLAGDGFAADFGGDLGFARGKRLDGAGRIH